jgi:hypothetical protein
MEIPTNTKGENEISRPRGNGVKAMGIVSIQVCDRKFVIIEYEDGRRVKYLYNHLLSENPGSTGDGIQMELNMRELALSGSENSRS